MESPKGPRVDHMESLGFDHLKMGFVGRLSGFLLGFKRPVFRIAGSFRGG